MLEKTPVRAETWKSFEGPSKCH